MLPVAKVQHAMAGRTRLRIPGMKGKTLFFADLEASLADQSGIDEVTTNALTGSVLLRHHGSLEDLQRLGDSRQLFHLRTEATPRASIWDELGDRMESVDDSIRIRTGGKMDLKAAVIAVLAAVALVQIFRGRVLGPAANLIGLAIGVFGLPDSIGGVGHGPAEGGHHG